MSIKVLLYNADGSDEILHFDEKICRKIKDRQLLWINILKRDAGLVRQVATACGLKNVPLASVLKDDERPKIEKFEDFYRLFVISIADKEKGWVKRVPIDFIVGKNFVITVHDGDVDYFEEFRDRDKGETTLGELDAESFLVTLLDLQIVTYFRALERIDARVDKFDEEILTRELDSLKFLKEILRLRREVSHLRRWLTPHRDVYYRLAHSDFKPIAASDSAEYFHLLAEHCENAIEAVENSRDMVLSLFDLYATRSDQRMNQIIQRLTYITFIWGGLAVIVGAFGMNFQVAFFEKGEYFWYTIAAMLTISLILTIWARAKKWI